MDQQALARAGIDYQSGVHRFAGYPAIYEKYLRKYFESNDLPALRQALERGDDEAAFRMAHNMKSDAGNLSLTDFYPVICQLVEALRAGVHDDSLLALCAEAEGLYDKARSAVEEAFYGSAD